MIAHIRKRLAAEDGFTLMELAVAIPMIAVVIAALTVTLTYSAGFSSEAQDASSLQIEMRSAMTQLTADLREAYTGSAAITPVESVTATTLSFYAPDRNTPFHLRHIWYRFQNGMLQRASVSSTNTGPASNWTWPAAPPVWIDQVHGLQSLSFAAFKGGSPPAPATTPDTVRSVVVAASARTAGGKGRSYDFTQTIGLRENASS